jgi:hypothetical protein
VVYDITAPRILVILAFYAALLTVIRVIKPRIEPFERRTALAIGLGWAVPVFVANYLLYKAGLLSYLPWVTNFMHSFLWIGVCLTFLYLGVRESQPMAVQVLLFATFSLIVKYAEQLAFGTWDLDHFLHVFDGNFAYVLGWSLADGTYPVITLLALRLVAGRIPRLAVT